MGTIKNKLPKIRTTMGAVCADDSEALGRACLTCMHDMYAWHACTTCMHHKKNMTCMYGMHAMHACIHDRRLNASKSESMLAKQCCPPLPVSHDKHLGSLLNHFGINLASFQDQFGIMLGSIGIILGSISDHFGIILGAVWDHFGKNWDHCGIILGSIRHHFGIIWKSFWADFDRDTGETG